MVDVNVEIRKIKKYAEENNVPIMLDDGIEFLLDYIKKFNVKKILEIGTAIGYSSIRMALLGNDIEVTTIERDNDRYLEAINNVKIFGLEDRIHLIFNDACNVNLDEKYDLIFIDAAKAQNIRFFEKFSYNLKETGTIITDNMLFHGLVESDDSLITSRNVRGLVRKIRAYKEFLINNERFDTEFLTIGDGIAISRFK